MAVDVVIGRNVHHLMWEKHIQHRAVYEAMGLTRGSLSKKLRGEVSWSAGDIEAAAKVLSVDPGRLFVVAGAGFEPATSGLRAWDGWLAPVIPIRWGIETPAAVAA